MWGAVGGILNIVLPLAMVVVVLIMLIILCNSPECKEPRQAPCTPAGPFQEMASASTAAGNLSISACNLSYHASPVVGTIAASVAIDLSRDMMLH